MENMINFVEKKTVKAETILSFLKEEWSYAHKMLERLGRNDERAQGHVSWCIGMKELAEAVIGVPVNLKLDGRTTIGLDEMEVEI